MVVKLDVDQITCIYVLFWAHGLWPSGFDKLPCLVFSICQLNHAILYFFPYGNPSVNCTCVIFVTKIKLNELFCHMFIYRFVLVSKCNKTCLSVPKRNKAFYTDAMTKLDFHAFDASIKTAPTLLKL